MKLLLIDNHIDKDCWGAEEIKKLIRSSSASKDFEIHTRRGPHNDLPENLSNYDKMIISGSRTSATATEKWIENQIRAIQNFNQPILGVCYGHQLIVRALFGIQHVSKSSTPEFGWTPIQLLRSSPLTQDLPESFYSFSHHYEQVIDLPKGLNLLASSPLCPVQAYEHQEKPIYGIQFHPEKNLSEAPKVLKDLKKKGESRFFLNYKDGKKLYESKIGEKIFDNFLCLKN